MNNNHIKSREEIDEIVQRKFRSNVIEDRTPRIASLDEKELIRYNQDLINSSMSPMELVQRLTRTNLEVALDKWITQDEKMLKLKTIITNIQYTTKNHCAVLITGPSGTGKELLAKAIGKPEQPFIARNCAGMPKELISSLFFGHIKGTFTGANEDRHGILVQAKHGVVFLDEIGDFPMELQATLLRAIQERTICRLGAVEEIEINCRFVAATKHNLRDMVEKGTFREDLFARLMTFELEVSPLLSRPDDIQLIAEKGADQVGEPFNWLQTARDRGMESAIPIETIRDDLARFNVRAIQTYIQRIKTYGYYR